MPIVKEIKTSHTGQHVITTDDGKKHVVSPDASDEVLNTRIACGEEYPFIDDANGNPTMRV